MGFPKVNTAILYPVLGLVLAGALLLIRRAHGRALQFEGISPAQIHAVRRQLIALALTLALAFPLVFAPLIDGQLRNQLLLPYAVLPFLPLVYLSVISIRYGVSLGHPKLFRGSAAIVMGLATLMVSLFGIALLIYIALRYVG